MDAEPYRAFLWSILQAQQPRAGLQWLESQLEKLTSAKAFFVAFSQAPRFVTKAQLHLTNAQLTRASRFRPGFDPSGWTTSQAARTLLLLRAPHGSPSEFATILSQLFSTADLTELITLYASLPLLPYPETHVLRAAEGVRTTMTSVFDAIALNNPYPHDYLPLEAWNQLVLKAVFNARPLYRIYGLDARRNGALARMLVDYAHERWAAGRELTPELWRMVGPFLVAEDLPDLDKLLSSPDALQRQAAQLALAESTLPEAQARRSQPAALAEANPDRAMTWQRIGESAYAAR